MPTPKRPRKKRTKNPRIYREKDYKGVSAIQKDGKVWLKYRDYSSKQNARNGLMSVMKAFGKSRHKEAPMSTVKVRKPDGSLTWAVYQLPKENFRGDPKDLKPKGNYGRGRM
jgi:hypothetical protein